MPTMVGLLHAIGCIALLPIAAFAAEVSVKDIPTRPGVTQRVLLIKPEQPVAGFVGIEEQVVKRIADWIKAQSRRS